MRRQSYSQGGTKVVIYAALIAVILGICFVITQDITVTTRHTSQEIKINLEK